MAFDTTSSINSSRASQIDNSEPAGQQDEGRHDRANGGVSGQIRGDTAEAYAHGVRFLIKNRLPDELGAEGASAK